MMIKRFLKPKWQHPNPEKRKQSLLKLDSTLANYEDILKELSGDQNSEVALLAISRINKLQTLEELLEQEASADRRQGLIKQVTDLLNSKDAESPSETEKLHFINNCQEQTLLVYLSHKVLDQTVQLSALKKIHSEDDLIDIAIQTSSPTIRLAAVEKIHDHDKLLSLSKQIRGRDKAAYRLVKNRLASENKERAKQEENILLRENLISAIEKLALKTFFPQYSQKLSLIQKQWVELEEQYRPSELEQRFQQANLVCQALVEEKKREEQQHKESLAAAAELINTCETLEKEMSAFNQKIQDEQINVPALKALIKTQQNRWQSAAERCKAPPETAQRYNKVIGQFELVIQAYLQYQSHQERLEQLLSEEQSPAQVKEFKSLLKEVSWPPDIHKPEQLNQAEKVLGEEKQIIKASKAKSQQELKAMQVKLEELKKAIEAGSLKAANHLNKEVSQAEKEGSLDKTTQQRFKLLAAQLKELNDWQGFSSAHKKEELCEKMEALKDKPCDPDDKAKQIMLLQEQWKQSGTSRDQALWLRFKSASDAAYEPCKAHFAQQAELRNKNLLERENICQQLNHFVENNDWQNANWPAALEIYHSAKQQWKQFSPVDRAKGNAVQKQFNTLLDKLNQLIKDEQTNNIKKKEALVAEAEKLLELNDQVEAIEQAKQLQAKWKTIGITPRKKDDQLWRSFRQHCDALFQRRDQARNEAKEFRKQQLNQAKSLCEELEGASTLSNEEILKTPDLAIQINKKLRALSDLPKEQKASILNRFNKAAEAFSTHLEYAQLRHKQTQLGNLRALAAWLNTLSQQPADLDADSIEEKWRTLSSDIPSPWLAPFEKRYQSTINGEAELAQANQEETIKVKALLCIRMEILAGLESPEEVKAERMAYQVNRLSAGLSSAKNTANGLTEPSNNSHEEATDIELEWLNTPFQPKQSELDKRFELARSTFWSHLLDDANAHSFHQQELENSL